MIQQSPAKRHPTISEVKQEISIKGQENVTLQKLDALRKEVVPISTPEDPLGGVDVDVEFYDYEYDDGRFIFLLTPDPPPNWFQELRQLKNAPSIRGMAQPTGIESLSRRHFEGPTGRYISIFANKEIAMEVEPIVKEWVRLANISYREMLEKKARDDERQRRAALEERRRKEADRALVLESIRKGRSTK
jgi:hypothetical protein